MAFTNSIQDYWGETLQGYDVIQVNTFSGQVDTACGSATSAVGPFYCPADTTVYLDLTFFDQLTGQLGAQGGDAAEAYVLAHEFGHHVQNLTGVMRQVQGSGQGTGPKSAGVRLELQADCYAGAWFKHATEDPDSPISEVSSRRPEPGGRCGVGGRRRPDPGEDPGPGDPGELDPRLGRAAAEVAGAGVLHRRPELLRHLRRRRPLTLSCQRADDSASRPASRATTWKSPPTDRRSRRLRGRISAARGRFPRV